MTDRPPFHIFICYAREDRDSLEALRRKLAPLKLSGLAHIWYDGEIIGGKDWDAEIRRNLQSADLVLLLISDDFFDSDYIDRVELREALEANARQENVVVPVILHDCIWRVHRELAKLQALPDEARPVHVEDHWKKPELGFANVAHGVVRVLEDPDTEVRRGRKNARFEAKRQADLAAEARRAKEAAAEQKRQAEAARKAQAAEAERLKNDPFHALMVPIKGGTFDMGSNENLAEKPVHKVTLSDFQLCKYPVTQAQWKQVMGSNPSHFKGDNLPVEQVSWEDVQVFLETLNRLTNKAYRLPTEAEWEYAARGGSLSKRYQYAGSNDPKEVAWFWENSGDKPLSGDWNLEKIKANNCRTHPVGQKKPNELGLYDMSGNVWEWCADWYAAYPASAQTDPAGPTEGANRVLRGGSWNNNPQICRAAYRNSYGPTYRIYSFGFRVALAASFQ